MLIERSSLMTRCYLSTCTLCWVRGMEETISFSHATWWGRRVIVMLMESKIHPSMVWHVDHEQSLPSSFFIENTSLRYLVSCRSRVRNTLLSAWNRVRRTCQRRCHGLCVSPRKSSMKTSTYARSFTLGRRR